MIVYFDVLPNGFIQQAKYNNPPEIVYGALTSLDSAQPNVVSAAANPLAWNYVGGDLIYVGIPDAALLPQAQQDKIAELQQGLQNTLNGGFTSKTTGHTYETTQNGQSNFIEALKLLELNTSITSLSFYTVDAGWVEHTPTQLQQAFVDGGAWKQAQYNQYSALETQVNQATTLATVQGISWSEASY